SDDVVLARVVSRIEATCAEVRCTIEQIVGANHHVHAPHGRLAWENPLKRQIHVEIEGPEIPENRILSGIRPSRVRHRVPILADIASYQHGPGEFVIPADTRNDLPARRPTCRIVNGNIRYDG